MTVNEKPLYIRDHLSEEDAILAFCGRKLDRWIERLTHLNGDEN